VELEDWNGLKFNVKYGSFSVGDESDKYRLKVASSSGSSAGSLTYHNNMPFSTKDRTWGRSCAVDYNGAWWYNSCHYSNLNGKYLGSNTIDPKGITWYYIKNTYYSFRKSEMKIRPVI
jgi:hypothetical protein